MTQKTKKLSRTGTKRRFRTAVNLEGTLKDHILTPVRGPNGVYIALREAINNSLDAKATKVRIKFGTYEKMPAIFITDNGIGMNRSGITSAMSYAFSSRNRDDVTTIGANGTGMKSLLGLNYNIEKTKITAYTIHKGDEPTKMEITFEYIVNLAKKKVSGDDYIETISMPRNWSEDMERATGTTVIITGFDGRKVKTPEQIINQLGEHLTPKACKFVEVKSGNLWYPVTPEAFKGEPFEIALESDHLGDVVFDLYYGTFGDGPKVCGPINEILPLTKLYLNMGKEQKGKVSKIWKTVSGHIYIPTANKYRMHEGGFSEEFYTSEACNELITMLKEVSEELEKLSNTVRDQRLRKKRDILIEKIVKAGSAINPITTDFIPTDSGNRPGGKLPWQSDQDYYILPKGLRMYPEETATITLRSQGKKEIDFSKTTWHADDKMISILYSRGNGAKVKALKVGSTQIVARGSFGTHTIQVIISHAPNVPFISGPNYVKPGDDYTYELKRHERDNVFWELQERMAGVTLRTDPSSKKIASIEVAKFCSDCTATLLVRNKSTRVVIAQKRVHISENGAMGPVSMIHIGKRDYILKKDFFFPDTIAQVDYAFNDSVIPEIIVNTIHPRIKDLSAYYAADPILVAIGGAAIIDQVSDGTVKREDAAQMIEEFVSAIKEQIREDLEKEKK